MFSLPVLILAQQKQIPGSMLAKPTEAGTGKIDTRVDNMGYWRKMADSGFVFVAPADNVPGATFTGSRIEDPMVMTTNAPDVPTTTVNSTQSENSVFVRPSDSSDLLNSNNSTPNPVAGIYGANYLLSTDGGATWGGSVNGAGGNNSGDPATAISLDNRYYIGFINSSSGQSVSYSTDFGATWTPVVAGSAAAGGLLDKNHLWIDNSPVSPYEGNLYNAWTPFGGSNDTEIEIVRSTNGGLNWSAPVVISTAVNAGSHNQGVNIQTGPDGEVYVAWAIYDGWPTDETAIGFARSFNGGVSYDAATRILSNIRGIRITQTGKNHRVNSFPSMATDISGGPNNGNIYIVWSNVGVPGINTGEDIDVYLIRSEDDGTNWSAPIRVNQDQAGLGKEHYFPWITCDPMTGDLSVVFYDDRNVASNQCEVYVAYSFDAGNSWNDFKVSDVAFTPAPIPGLASSYMGDYLGIASRGGKVYPTWADNRTGTVITYVSPFELTRIPGAEFAAETTTPCLNDTIIMQDQSIKNPQSWSWSISPATYAFVNGTSSSSQNPEVKFTAYGNYSVQLIVTNSYGADTLLKNNFISVNFANADFSSSNLTPIINTPVVFTDLSSCNVSSYSWNFGSDATPSTAITPGPHTVTYASAGFKTVSLTVNGNVTNTKTDYIQVLPEIYNMTNGSLTVCTGTFYDPQGTSSYLNNLNYTMTFYPGDTTKSIQMAFSLFDLEAEANCGYDYLKIYDGENTLAPLIGTWCGTSSPGTVTSSHQTGALTFAFHSDVSVVGQGWLASVSCVDPPPPSYCIANATVCDEYISRVVYEAVDNSTGCTAGGYGNYTNLSAKVSPGVNYNIVITNGNLGWPQDQCGIWVDWNQDSDFNDAGETITVSGSPGTGPYSATIVPPANAVKGMTRLRVRITYTGEVSPCGTTYYGEVEDYGIYVGTPGLWSGSAGGGGTNWNDPLNWDDGRVPPTSTDVIIPEAAPSYPVIAGTITCSDLHVHDGAIMTIEQGSSFNINGNLVIGEGNTGIFTVNGGACNVAGNITSQPGSSVQVINGGILNDID
jgi:PKD repeat protein